MAAFVPSMPVKAAKKRACRKSHVYHLRIEVAASHHFTFVSDDSSFPGTQKGDFGWSELYEDAPYQVRHDCKSHAAFIDMPRKGENAPTPASSTAVWDVTDSRVSTSSSASADAKRPCQFHGSSNGNMPSPGWEGKMIGYVGQDRWAFTLLSGIGASGDSLLDDAYIQAVLETYRASCPEHPLEVRTIDEDAIVGHQTVAAVDPRIPSVIVGGNGPAPAPENVEGLTHGRAPTELGTGDVPFGTNAPGEVSGTWSLKLTFTRVSG
jgi:hypothetical protein